MVVARLDRYLPVNGHVVIVCGLLTAVDLVVLALARRPGVTGCGILTTIGLSEGVRVHMFVGEVALTSRGHAIPLPALGRAFTSVL